MGCLPYKLMARQVINGFLSDWHTQALAPGALPAGDEEASWPSSVTVSEVSIRPCLPGHCQICFNVRQLFSLPSGSRAHHSGELDHVCYVMHLSFSLKNSATSYSWFTFVNLTHRFSFLSHAACQIKVSPVLPVRVQGCILVSSPVYALNLAQLPCFKWWVSQFAQMYLSF